MPDQVGFHQIMRDALMLRRPATGGREDGADQSLQTIGRDFHSWSLLVVQRQAGQMSKVKGQMIFETLNL
jgi:hypothetical protein